MRVSSMLEMWWPPSRRRRDLSAFADGELRDAAADRVAERIVFDEAARDELARVRQLDRLLGAALTPPAPSASADMVADAVLSHVAPPRAATRNWTPTVVASVGLLLTAGVAVAGLKRRGRI